VLWTQRVVRVFHGLPGYTDTSSATILLDVRGRGAIPCRPARSLTKAPVLHLPMFDMPFIVECDAPRLGFNAVLHQDKGPVTFFSCQIVSRHDKLAAYERELMVLAQAVRH
jgi:hypothetical protein